MRRVKSLLFIDEIGDKVINFGRMSNLLILKGGICMESNNDFEFRNFKKEGDDYSSEICDIVDNSIYIKNKDLPKKKSNLKTYISLVLITSIISSVSVGGILYSKFSDQINKQTALIEKTAINSQVSSNARV